MKNVANYNFSLFAHNVNAREYTHKPRNKRIFETPTFPFSDS